jgi:CheY-like chemotaxis protein
VVILLVDDMQDAREVCRLMLERLGHQVIGVSDGKEAVQTATVSRPDVILMDLSMPGVDGLLATAALRTISTLIDIPIVAMTAYPRELSREKALNAGCDAYLEKPFSMESLASTLHKLLPTDPRDQS